MFSAVFEKDLSKISKKILSLHNFNSAMPPAGKRLKARQSSESDSESSASEAQSRSPSIDEINLSKDNLFKGKNSDSGDDSKAETKADEDSKDHSSSF